MTVGAAPPDAALEAAAEWFVLLRSSDATSADRQRWQAWLDSAPAHRQAWQYVERIQARFSPVQESPARLAAVQALQRTRRPAQASRRRLLGWGGAALATGLGWAGWRHTELPARALAWTADEHTGVGEVRRVALPDGSALWLNALSAIDLDFSGSLRRVHLRSGEIQIQTASAPGREFVVDTRHGRLRALGTRFTARLASDATFAAVYEGAVAVAPRDGAGGVVPAGQQAWFTKQAMMPPSPAHAIHDTWTRGLLIADNLSLAELVQSLSRAYGGHISVAADVASLRVFGSYPAQDPPRALDMLASVMPIEVRQWVPGWLHVKRRA